VTSQSEKVRLYPVEVRWYLSRPGGRTRPHGMRL
jgi:hypothetical protein